MGPRAKIMERNDLQVMPIHAVNYNVYKYVLFISINFLAIWTKCILFIYVLLIISAQWLLFSF
jgi:hypothetical protein